MITSEYWCAPGISLSTIATPNFYAQTFDFIAIRTIFLLLVSILKVSLNPAFRSTTCFSHKVSLHPHLKYVVTRNLSSFHRFSFLIAGFIYLAIGFFPLKSKSINRKFLKSHRKLLQSSKCLISIFSTIQTYQENFCSCLYNMTTVH